MRRTLGFGIFLALGLGMVGWSTWSNGSTKHHEASRDGTSAKGVASAYHVTVETSSGGADVPREDLGDSLLAAPLLSAPSVSPPPKPANLDVPAIPTHAMATHHTTLRAKLHAAEHRIDGEEEIRWKNTATVPVSELSVHLYLNAFKNESSLFLRGRLGAGRGGRIPSAWGYTDIQRFTVRPLGPNDEPTGDAVDVLPVLERAKLDDPDETDWRVPLPSPCPPGGHLEIAIAFVSQLPTIVERVGYQGSFHMVAQWFPKLASLSADGRWNHFPFHRLSEFSADFGFYDVSLDVPAEFVVGATGQRVEEHTAAGRTVSRYEQGDVHDFAWTAWDQFRQRDVALPGGVRGRWLYPRGHEPAVTRGTEALHGALACYGRRYGPYPYGTLTVVHPPPGAEEAGGMEYPTLITTGGPWYGPPGVRAAESLVTHEFGHQHFYGLVATDEHRWPFLDEGLNSYGESQCLEEMYGTGSTVDFFGVRVQTAALMREAALGLGRDEAIAVAAPLFPTAHHYGSLVYARTASLLRTLGGAFGRDVVDGALGRYTRRYRFAHPGPDALLEAFNEAGGPELQAALRVGLFERGWVDFAVEQLSSTARMNPGGIFDRPTGRETVASGTPAGFFAGGALVVRQGTLALPVDVELRFADGTCLRQRWSGHERWVNYSVTGPSELVSVVVDPDGHIELDERWDNNARSVQPATIAWRVWERLAYSFGLFLFGVSP